MSKNTPGNNFALTDRELLLLVIGGAVGLGCGAFMVKHYLAKGNNTPVASFIKVAERVAVLEEQVKEIPAQQQKIIALRAERRELNLKTEEDLLERKKQLECLFEYSMQTNWELCSLMAEVLSQNGARDKQELLKKFKAMTIERATEVLKEMGLPDKIEDLCEAPPEDPHEEKLYVPLAGED